MSFRCVVIYYGPCESFNTSCYKSHKKLMGLRDRLQKLNFRVILAPVIYKDYCVLEMCGHEVFRCNIQNLLFNMPYHKDPVCQRAVNACLDASAKLIRARTYLWMWTLIDHQIFSRSDYNAVDWWPDANEERLKPFATCLDCIKCCGILVQKKTT